MFERAHASFELMYVERGNFHNAVSGEAMALDRSILALLDPGTLRGPYIHTDNDLVVKLMIDTRRWSAPFNP